jgi:thioredoxin-like negative regulator of GroEL
MQQRRQAAAAAARQQSTSARRQVALERLVAHLTGPVSDERGDGP